MITEFGKALRKIRIDHGEILKDMAEHLRVTPSFLSAVEIGKKNVPTEWVDTLTREYQLPKQEADCLATLAKDAVTAIKLNLSGSTQSKRSAALVFARDFGSISDDTAEKIIKLLQKDSK